MKILDAGAKGSKNHFDPYNLYNFDRSFFTKTAVKFCSLRLLESLTSWWQYFLLNDGL